MVGKWCKTMCSMQDFEVQVSRTLAEKVLSIGLQSPMHLLLLVVSKNFFVLKGLDLLGISLQAAVCLFLVFFGAPAFAVFDYLAQ